MRIHELDGFLKTGEAEPDMWLQLTFIGGVVCRRAFQLPENKKDRQREQVILIVGLILQGGRQILTSPEFE